MQIANLFNGETFSRRTICSSNDVTLIQAKRRWMVIEAKRRWMVMVDIYARFEFDVEFFDCAIFRESAGRSGAPHAGDGTLCCFGVVLVNSASCATAYKRLVISAV